MTLRTRAVVAQVSSLFLTAVVDSGLPRARKSAGVPLKLVDFLGSVKQLAWAKSNGCPWHGGHLKHVLDRR